MIQCFEFFQELLRAFFMRRVSDNTVDGANVDALGVIVMADTFCAFMRVDFINTFAVINRFVGTGGFTHVAVDTICFNQ